MASVILIAFMIGVYSLLSGGRRDQTCRGCGEAIRWVGLPLGWVHRRTGRDWEPCTWDEWFARDRSADIPAPHPALPYTDLP